MPRAQLIQNSFNSGEFSPRLSARVDFKKYANAVETLENFIPLVHGGVKRRPGTRFVKEIKDSTKKARLLDFEFSNQQAYVVELGPTWVRFYRDSARIESGDTDASITNGTFATDLSSWTDRDAGTGVSAHNGTNNTMELDGGGGGNEARRYQTVSVGATFDENLHVLKFRVFNTAAAGNTVTLRVGSSIGGSEVLPDQTYTKGWHCQEFIPGNTTIYIEFESTTADVEIDDVSLIDNDAVEIGNDYSAAQITDIQWAQSADIMWLTEWTHKPMKLTRTGHHSWSLTEYTPTTDPFTTGTTYPRAVGFHEQRILFLATKTDPQAVFGSKSGDFEDMTTGTADDDGFKFALASGKVNVGVWLASSDKGLLVGTLGSEYTMAGEDNLALTPTNVLADRRTQHGSREVVQAVQVGNVTLFVQRAGRKIREFVFNFEDDTFVAPDLMVLAEHLTGPQTPTTIGVGLTLTDVHYAQEPDSLLWAVRSDGKLLACAYDRSQDVVGWSLQSIGGTSAVVDSLTCIPHPDGDKSQVWVIVARTIGGATKRYVEYIGESGGSFYSDVLLDSAVVGNNLSQATTLTGLAHLNGETVGVLGDGAVYPDATVASGQITGLSPAVDDAEVGFNYTSTLKTLRPDAQTSEGTIQGLRKQRPEVRVRILNTLGIRIENQQLAWRSPADPMDAVVPLQSREVEVRRLGWSRDAQVTITQALPMPTHLLAITGALEIE